MSLQVLYEDNHLIAVYKPAGVLVQSDKTGDATLMDEVKLYLKTKYQKTGNVFLGLIHRLDRPVSGVILFAKTSKGASRLSEQFREHTVEKIYHAWVVGKPKQDKGELVHYILKNEKNNKVEIFDKPQAGAQRAELDYEVVEKKPGMSLLKVTLGTGRSHQIRSQLARIGCPIVGDIKYGGNNRSASDPHHSIALAATSLTFTTATTDEQVTVTGPLPIVDKR
jgi:23S rRNA pseudouridine1911/1915/1917 synthase